MSAVLPYPKMLVSREYLDHCDVQDHDSDRSRRKAMCTKRVENPDELATALRAGWREFLTDFTDEPAVEAAESEEEVERPVRRSGRRSAAENPQLE